MHLNFLFKKDNDNISKKGKVNVPDGLFTKCPKCSKMILTDELFLDNCVCHSCGYYFKIDAKTRISMVIDKDTFEEWDTGIEEKNPCDFEGYIQKTADLKSKTGLDEAIVTGKGKIAVKPDKIRLYVNKEELCKEYEDTLRRSTEDTELLKDLFEKLGFQRKDLKTVYFNVDTEYESY